MAKDILVTESLSDSMIKAGTKLIGKLDAMNAEVKSAFWLYSSEDKTWKLIISSPLVDTVGPREYYRKIVAANNSLPKENETISLNEIVVTNTTNNFVKTLNFGIAIDNGCSGVRLSRNTINGNFIDDVYIYRSS